MASVTAAGAGDGLKAGDIAAVAFVVDQRPGPGERRRAQIVRVPAHRIAGRVAYAAIDAFDGSVGRFSRRRIWPDLRDRVMSRLGRRKGALRLLPFFKKRLHVGGEILDHRQIRKWTDFKLATARDLGDMGAQRGLPLTVIAQEPQTPTRQAKR